MQSLRNWNGRTVRFAAMMVSMLVALGLLAQAEKKVSNEQSGPAAERSSHAAPASGHAGGSPSTAGHAHSAAPHGPTAGYHEGNRGATLHTPPKGPGSSTAKVQPSRHPSPTVSGTPQVHHEPASNLEPTRHTSPTAHGTNSRLIRTSDSVSPHRPEMGDRHDERGWHATSTSIQGRPAPRGSHEIRLRDGSAVQRRFDGRVSDLHDARRGMDVHHGINGNTVVVVERRDHSRIFAERGRPGYVEHEYVHNGHEYERRTYYFHGRAYDRYYSRYPYRGVYIQVYAPVRYYPVGFYGWAYHPWYHAIVYSWGWRGSPWYGYYGGYFTPYPVYPTASLWLTDYIISSELAAAYEARQEAHIQAEMDADAGAAPLTPEVKQMIADEVKNQLAQENAEAEQNARNQAYDPGSGSIAGLFSDGKAHVFVAGHPLDLVDIDGNECAVSDGDALQLATPPPPEATSANLIVMSSKGGRECRKSDVVAVSLSDLQDMQNHMRETIDQGLQELQAKQGTGGLPAAPPSATGAPVEAPIAQGAPPPDTNGADEVNQQLADADQAEQEVVGQAQQETGTNQPAGPVTIALGQSMEEVSANFGPPLTVIDLGSKKIYKYKDMKVTFLDGKVADVE